MESRLIHHALEWLTRIYKDTGKHATKETWKHNRTGIFAFPGREACERPFESKREQSTGSLRTCSLEDQKNPYIPRGAIEGAQQDLKTVKTLIRANFGHDVNSHKDQVVVQFEIHRAGQAGPACGKLWACRKRNSLRPTNRPRLRNSWIALRRR
jgi:hypothetical protein